MPLWGKRIPAVLNTRLGGYTAGQQQFDYPVQSVVVGSGSKTVTIAPGAQTGLFKSVGRLDPHSYRPNEFFSNNWVYEGLVSYGADGTILPALATSWTESGMTTTFTLRTGVKFTDGADWNCAAAKLNLAHVMASPLRTGDFHLWYHLPAVISSWECDADGKLKITTSTASSVLLQELSFIRPLRFLSPQSFKSTAADSWKTHNSCPSGWGEITHEGVTIKCVGITAPVGTGPFKMDSRTQETLNAGTDDETTADNEVVFKRNTDWWGATPDIETLVIKRYATASDVAGALKDGTLDMVVGDGVLAPKDVTNFMTHPDFSVTWTGVLMHSIVIINSGKKPTDDIEVRKAIIHGIDKAKIIKKELSGIGSAVDRLFPDTAPYSSVELTPRWDYDFQKAEMLNCPLKPVTKEVIKEVIKEVEGHAEGHSDEAATDDDDNKTNVSLILIIVILLGIPLVLSIVAAYVWYTRSQKVAAELKIALTQAQPVANAENPAANKMGADETIDSQI